MRRMATMSMNKAIHGAFRRDLDRFVTALSTFTPRDTRRADQLARAWENFDRQLTDHHEGEHAIAWPALEQVGVSREVLAEMDAEHAAMAAALDGARTAMTALQAQPGQEQADTALACLQRLREVTTDHLDHEEREIEPVFLAHEDSAPIREMGRQFARVGPVRGGRFFAWVSDGAGPEEMAAIEENVPPAVMAVMKNVFGRRYRRVARTWAD